MKFNHKLKREKFVAVTLCFGVSLSMSFQIGSTELFIASMLGIITVGAYIMVLSGKWR
jgi:hypothetical protein